MIRGTHINYKKEHGNRGQGFARMHDNSTEPRAICTSRSGRPIFRLFVLPSSLLGRPSASQRTMEDRRCHVKQYGVFNEIKLIDNERVCTLLG